MQTNKIYPKDENKEKEKYVKTLKIDHYYVIKHLGSGTFADVSLGIHDLLEKKIAIKKISKNKIKNHKNINRHKMEIKIMKSNVIYKNYFLNKVKW